jgi:hypothetical protein
MATCLAIFEEEESHAFEVYTGNVSIGKRALQRVLMKSRLEAMQTELREIMVYQCPPELGDLYTRTEEMMQRIKKEQSVAIKIKREKDGKAAIIRARRINYLKNKITHWSIVFFSILYIICLIWSVVEIRKSERHELGVCLIPKGSWGYKQYNSLKWVDCEPK